MHSSSVAVLTDYFMFAILCVIIGGKIIHCSQHSNVAKVPAAKEHTRLIFLFRTSILIIGLRGIK